MERIQKVSHKGKTIILMDFSNCKPAETIELMGAAEKVIATSAPKKALILSDVTGAMYTKEVAERMKEFTKHNTPYVLGSAAVGVSGVQMILLQTLIFITRREIKLFPSRQEAMDWLAQQ
jgi:hypothetical protein